MFVVYSAIIKIMKKGNTGKLDILKLRLFNTVLTLIVLSLPILRERAQLPTGGYEIVRYRPIFLLTSYLQMQDYYPFLLMIGFSLFVYVISSLVVFILQKLLAKIGR